MNNSYYFLYYFFDNPLIRWLRVLVFLLIGVFVYFNIHNGDFVIRLLPVYFILILQELFIHFSLESRQPQKKVSEDSYKHVIECVDFKTRAYLERHPKMQDVIGEIKGEHTVRYFNRLLDYEISGTAVFIDENELLKKAEEVVVMVKGNYVHAVDIYAAYLMLLDEKTKELFNKGIDEKDVLVVLSWVRKQANIDGKKHTGLHFAGNGVFDFFVYGWSAELAKYASNFTLEALSQTRSRPIGRDSEYDLLVTALSKNSASNALLVGKAGVGKTSLIWQFAVDSNNGLLPSNLTNKVVFKLFVERLLAGIENEGDLEVRFVNLFSELIHAGNIVVYIPNIETIFGGGGLNFDLSGSLSEYLRSNRIKIVGSITPEAFQKYIYQKQEIKELFDVIEMDEPDNDTACFMVLEKAGEFERINHISISYSGVKEACVLSDSYANDGTAMPGRAIRLLDDVLTNAMTHGIRNITKTQVQDFVQQKTHIVLDEPTREESQKLLNLEKDLHAQVISQNEAVSAIADAMRRVRSGMQDQGRPIASFLFLGPTGVGKTETAKALAKSYFGDEEAMIRLDMSEYQNPDAVEKLLGGNANEYGDALTDKILKRPFTLLLLDEFEKAYPPLLNLFLQVLDEGHLTDNQGRTVSFKNAIIIATSNAGSELIREEYKEGVRNDEFKKHLLDKILQANIFKPELVNRFDDIIVFRSLTQEDVKQVAKLFLKELINRIAEKQITLTYDESSVEFIAKNAYSVEFGARNIKRFIDQAIGNNLSKMILSQELPGGSTALIMVEGGSLVIKK